MADFQAIQKLDLNLLKVFESIYQEQNMSRTAELLHISPSAVSHALRRLRDCLEDPLFERSRNRMLPTPACQRMAPLIIDTLSRLRQILQHWGEFEPATSQHHFRIGMHYALEPYILPLLTKEVLEHAPNTTFSSVKVDREHLTRELGAGHIDMAFDVALPIKPPVLHKKLINDEFCVLLRKDHPLGGNLTQATYFSALHIGVSNRPSGAAVEDILFQQQGLARQISIRCQNYAAAKTMVESSDYLLTLPRQLAAQMPLERVQLSAVPFEGSRIETHLYWHKNTEQDTALAWLRGRLDDLFEGISSSLFPH
ncbi:MAG: DNA-binding transcriptional LysR family regulator [Paraglaciecola sp.]|jgi:DNA-binding transcriptional LysR family regulator